MLLKRDLIKWKFELFLDNFPQTFLSPGMEKFSLIRGGRGAKLPGKLHRHLFVGLAIEENVIIWKLVHHDVTRGRRREGKLFCICGNGRIYESQPRRQSSVIRLSRQIIKLRRLIGLICF